MAATLIYCKKALKIFFSGTKRPMTLGLGMQHPGLGPNNVCSNDNLRFTLTFFTPRSSLLPNAFILENIHFFRKTVGKSSTTNDRSHKMFLLTSNFLSPRDCLPLPGAIYMYKRMKKREIVLKLATNGQCNKALLLTSKFCPRGLSESGSG